MKLIKLLIFIIFVGAVAALIWWIKENPDEWRKYQPTTVKFQKIKKPVENVTEAIIEAVKDDNSEQPKPVPVASKMIEPPPVKESAKIEEQGPERDLVKVEESYDDTLTTSQAITILQALKGEKEPE